MLATKTGLKRTCWIAKLVCSGRKHKKCFEDAEAQQRE